MARLSAPAAVLLAALLLAGAEAIIVGRVYRPVVVATPFGARRCMRGCACGL